MSEASWGLDMAGMSGSLNSLSAAGGIGGLLATRDRGADLGSGADDKSYAHFYDGNGNTAQLVQVGNDTTVAAYEYDAYGQLEASAGSYATENRWRFSTKLFESDTELGYRYRCMMRWASRAGPRSPEASDLGDCSIHAIADGSTWSTLAMAQPGAIRLARLSPAGAARTRNDKGYLVRYGNKASTWPSNFFTYRPAPESAWYKVPDSPDSDEARNLPGGW